jgi:hypothetical protein
VEGSKRRSLKQKNTTIRIIAPRRATACAKRPLFQERAPPNGAEVKEFEDETRALVGLVADKRMARSVDGGSQFFCETRNARDGANLRVDVSVTLPILHLFSPRQ